MGKGWKWTFGGAQLVLLLGVGLLIAGLIVVLKVVPDSTKKTIKNAKVLVQYPNQTRNDFTNSWVNPTYLSTMQYWVYDYKNALGVVNRGMAPDMDQKGPYGYREVTEMEILAVDANLETLNYTQHTKYIFDPSRSCKGCNPMVDKVKVPDISFLMAIQQLRDFAHFCEYLNTMIPPVLQSAINDTCQLTVIEPFYDEQIVPLLGLAVSAFDTAPFIEVTVHELLFSGYKAPFVEKFMRNLLLVLDDIIILIGQGTIASILQTIELAPVNVSYIGSLESYGPEYMILTGKSDSDKVGYILGFTDGNTSSVGQSLPAHWWTASCSKGTNAFVLDGNTGDFYPSFLKRDQKVPVYVSDICRTVNMEYDSDITHHDIDGYRFVLPKDAFDYSKEDNCGFCNQLTYGFYNKDANSTCLPNGVLDISRCQEGKPIAASKPHFYQAESVITSFNPRFKPGLDDETTMDVEPLTGAILAANKRLQVNLLWNQFPHINSFKVMRPAAYPIFWINESFIADSETIKDLKNQLSPIRTYNIICWTAVGVGGLLIVISFIMDVVLVFFRKKND